MVQADKKIHRRLDYSVECAMAPVMVNFGRLRKAATAATIRRREEPGALGTYCWQGTRRAATVLDSERAKGCAWVG